MFEGSIPYSVTLSDVYSFLKLYEISNGYSKSTSSNNILISWILRSRHAAKTVECVL